PGRLQELTSWRCPPDKNFSEFLGRRSRGARRPARSEPGPLVAAPGNGTWTRCIMADSASAEVIPGGASARPGEASPPLLDRLHEEQRAYWQRGERVLVEALLEQHPTLWADTDGLLDLIYHEVLLREEHGEAPWLDDYLRRFPQLAAALRHQFEVH